MNNSVPFITKKFNQTKVFNKNVLNKKVIKILKFVLFALLKKTLTIFKINLESLNSVTIKEFQHDTITKKLVYYKHLKIKKHVLNIWIID